MPVVASVFTASGINIVIMALQGALVASGDISDHDPQASSSAASTGPSAESDSVSDESDSDYNPDHSELDGGAIAHESDSEGLNSEDANTSAVLTPLHVFAAGGAAPDFLHAMQASVSAHATVTHNPALVQQLHSEEALEHP